MNSEKGTLFQRQGMQFEESVKTILQEVLQKYEMDFEVNSPIQGLARRCVLIIRDDARLERAEPLVFLAHGFGVVRSSNLQKEVSKMVEEKDYGPVSGAHESASPRSKLKQLGDVQQLETMIEKGPLSVVQAASELV